jgi:hypothetical protein
MYTAPSGHWETVDNGDGSLTYWVEDPAPAPIPDNFQVIRDASDKFGRDMNGDWRTGGGTNDVGGYLPAETWRAVGFTGPTLENYGSGSGDSSEVRTSSELLAFMRDGGYQLGQGYDASTGETVDQLFKGETPIGDAHRFVYEDNAFTVAALAAGALVTWAAAGAAAGAGAGAAEVAAADAGITYAGEAYAAEALAAEAFVGELGVGIAASGAAAEGYAAEVAAADAFAGAAPAAVASSSSLGSLASGASSIVDTIGNAAGAVFKAAGAVLAPVAAQALGEKLRDELAPNKPTAGVTYQPLSQAAPGATLMPLLLIAGAVVLAYLALRKST